MKIRVQIKGDTWVGEEYSFDETEYSSRGELFINCLLAEMVCMVRDELDFHWLHSCYALYFEVEGIVKLEVTWLSWEELWDIDKLTLVISDAATRIKDEIRRNNAY